MTETTVLDQLKVLAQLQELDAQIYQLKQAIEIEPEEEAQIKADQESAAQDLAATEEHYKSSELKRKEMEVELGGKESQIQKLQGQLFQLKTNKEYTAMQKEIDGLKADKSVFEEEILKSMEEGEGGKEKLNAAREAHKAKEAEFAKQLEVVRQKKEQALAQVQELEKGRTDLAPQVDSKILSQYETILHRKAGVALVPVEGESCSGCFMRLPPQSVNEIQLGNRLITCESCARILYFKDQA